MHRETKTEARRVKVYFVYNRAVETALEKNICKRFNPAECDLP